MLGREVDGCSSLYHSPSYCRGFALKSAMGCRMGNSAILRHNAHYQRLECLWTQRPRARWLCFYAQGKGDTQRDYGTNWGILCRVEGVLFGVLVYRDSKLYFLLPPRF